MALMIVCLLYVDTCWYKGSVSTIYVVKEQCIAAQKLNNGTRVWCIDTTGNYLGPKS